MLTCEVQFLTRSNRPAESLTKPAAYPERGIYAAPQLHETGAGLKNSREVVTCRMNRTLYRWTGEARVKQENLGEKVAVHPARHED